MKSISRFIVLMVVVALAAGCSNYNYKKTASGVMYSISGKGGEKLKSGDFVKVNYKVMIGDSVIIDTYSGLPAYGQYDTAHINLHDFVDFFNEMRVGDSAVYIRSIDTMKNRGYLMYNEVFKPGGTLKGFVTVLGKFPSKEAMMQDQQLQLVKLKEREIARLEEYLKEEKITGAIKTAKGAFVKMDSEGSGPAADSGMVVVVNYTGKLKNGNKFDSNTDSSFGHVSPLEFTVGTGAVIEGWDDAIRHFKKGGKGRIFIPSSLGYGGNPQGDKLPAFSDLIFDIDILDVKPQSAQVPGIQPGEHQ